MRYWLFLLRLHWMYILHTKLAYSVAFLSPDAMLAIFNLIFLSSSKIIWIGGTITNSNSRNRYCIFSKIAFTYLNCCSANIAKQNLPQQPMIGSANWIFEFSYKRFHSQSTSVILNTKWWIRKVIIILRRSDACCLELTSFSAALLFCSFGVFSVGKARVVGERHYDDSKLDPVAVLSSRHW